MTLRDQIFVLALMAVIYALLVPVIELFPSDPVSVGDEAIWRVVDNGQGANAPPDQISRTFNPADFRISASDFCEGTPGGLPGVRDLEAATT